MSKCRDIIRLVYYPLKRMFDYGEYKRFIKESAIQVRDTNETIRYILANQVSVSRFGDGEYMVMNQSGNGFQCPDKKLGERLKEVLNSNLSNHIVCLPYAFVSTKQMTNDAKNFWFPFCGSYRDFILKTTNQEKTYYDTNFTRFYMDMKDKGKVGHVVGQLKKIWEGRPVFIIEGRYSCLGIGNDLFDNAKSIRRIICPSQNAFSKYDEIFETATKIIPKDCLILSALGMTATVLCYDLSRRGYQAIDIGHIDIEYSWFRMRAKKKCSVPGKAVNEISNMPEKECSDNKYSESIVAVIQ